MNYNQSENGRVNETSRATDTELLAELISRMNQSSNERQGTQTPPAGETGRAKSINLIELFYYFLSKLHFIVLGMVIGGVLMGMYAQARIVPIYSATSKIYIVGSSGISIISDLQIGSVLTMDYQEVFKTWEVHQLVNEELGTNYSYSALQSMVSVDIPDDTRVMYITVRSTDPQLAADIANAYAKAAKKFIVQIMKMDEPTDFSIALVPGVAATASITGSVIKGMMAGTVLVCGVLLLLLLLDNRPKTPEDIQRYAGIPTLAAIPKNGLFVDNKKGKRGGDAD